MPIYKCNGAVHFNGTKYPHDGLVDIPDGAVRDALLKVGAIYRTDRGPGLPRYYHGGLFLPFVKVSQPQWGAPPGWTFVAGQSIPTGFDEATFLAIRQRYLTGPGPTHLQPLDEWAIPDPQWPPPLSQWELFPVSFAPARGLRPIP
jgi:hypothetical protein